ncbi:MAG: class I SAM-dependent methyltransferase [Bdellovibrio sp.]|nr:class I SAM-dependent methyltransferase [Bdellovibrio sp.]
MTTRNAKSSFLLLHDPHHSKIRARLWSSQQGQSDRCDMETFHLQLVERLKAALTKRKMLKSSHPQVFNRDNYYLFFAEADFIPGLQGLLLGNSFILFDFTRTIWEPHIDFIFSQVKQLTSTVLNQDIQEFFYQKRPGPFLSYPSKTAAPANDFVIAEFNLRYSLNFNLGSDLGLYTDMSSVRFHTSPLYSDARVLNLFSYTGAFSLFALSQGARQVTSVDLSPKYMARLNENLLLNPQLNASIHHSLVGPVNSKVKELIDASALFDVIVCDPPSASSDGHSQHNHWKSMGEFLSMLDTLVASGGTLLVFNNTHQITRKKFEQDLAQIPALNKYTLREFYGLSFDCPRLPHFPEGDYLKGVALKKNHV